MSLIGVHDRHIDLPRRFLHARHGVFVEVALNDFAQSKQSGPIPPPRIAKRPGGDDSLARVSNGNDLGCRIQTPQIIWIACHDGVSPLLARITTEAAITS